VARPEFPRKQDAETKCKAQPGHDDAERHAVSPHQVQHLDEDPCNACREQRVAGLAMAAAPAACCLAHRAAHRAEQARNTGRRLVEVGKHPRACHASRGNKGFRRRACRAAASESDGSAARRAWSRPIMAGSP